MALRAPVEGHNEECVKLLIRRQGGGANHLSQYTYVRTRGPRSLPPVYCEYHVPGKVSGCYLGSLYSPRTQLLLLEAGSGHGIGRSTGSRGVGAERHALGNRHVG